jgi:hypothetical protein
VTDGVKFSVAVGLIKQMNYAVDFYRRGRAYSVFFTFLSYRQFLVEDEIFSVIRFGYSDSEGIVHNRVIEQCFATDFDDCRVFCKQFSGDFGFICKKHFFSCFLRRQGSFVYLYYIIIDAKSQVAYMIYGDDFLFDILISV